LLRSGFCFWFLRLERDLQQDRPFFSSLLGDERVNFAAFLLVALGILLLIALPSCPPQPPMGLIPSVAIGAATALVLVVFVTGRI